MTKHGHVFPERSRKLHWSRDMTTLWHHASWFRVTSPHVWYMRTPHRSCMLIHAHAAFLDVLSYSMMFYLLLFVHDHLVYIDTMYRSKVPRTVLVLYQSSNLNFTYLFHCLELVSKVSWQTVADIRTVLPISHSLYHCTLSRPHQPHLSSSHVAPLCLVSLINKINSC